MPYVHPKSRFWYGSFVDAGGTRTRRSTRVERVGQPGSTTYREAYLRAAAVEGRWREQVHQERFLGASPRYTYDELMLRYLNEGASQAQKASTFETTKQAAKKLHEHFSGNVLSELEGKHIHRYKKARMQLGINPQTVRRELAVLSRAINWAREELSWDVPNVVARRLPPEPTPKQSRSRWIPRAVAASFLEQAARSTSPALYDFIVLGLYTGMRAGEILKLEWSRVDLSGGWIYLTPQDQKNNKQGSVPLNKHALMTIRRRLAFHAKHCPGSPWVFCHDDGTRVKSVRTAWRTACRNAGIEDFRRHDLRHTCASWLRQAGVSLDDIKDLLRHSRITQTERYAHITPERVRETASMLDGLYRREP